MSGDIRVALCDDHGILRAGLKALLSAEPDMRVVGEAGSGEELIEHAAVWAPTVVLMDISLPGINGMEATRRLLCQLPACHVLILTMHQRPGYLTRALLAGACGYVLKSDLDTELLKAIRTASRDEAFVYSSDAAPLFRAYLEGETEGKRYGLTEMEEHVLTHTAQGQTLQEIAQALNISPGSVNTYRGRVLAKLGLERRAHLVQWAIEHGLLNE